MTTDSVEDIVKLLDEWSGGLPNGDHKEILVAAADKLEELEQAVNANRLDHTADFFTLKLR